MSEIKVLSDIEHVLQVSGRYIGVNKKKTSIEYVLEDKRFVKKEVEFVPAFLTLCNEIISNSIDVFIKSNGKFANKIDISIQNDAQITVKDNGSGISSNLENKTKLPESVVVFTNLRAGSNFNDKNKNIGMHGEGASLVNIFSKRFEVQTADGKTKTHLVCKNNLSTYDYKISKSNMHYTKTIFILDFERLSMNKIDKDHISILHKRIIDYAVSYPKIKFTFNGRLIKTKSFEDYVSLYEEKENFEFQSTDKMDIAIIHGDQEFISFVNGINTKRGGEHVETSFKFITHEIRNLISKKYKEIKPADIRNKIGLIINLKDLTAPRFDSQTKEQLNNTYKELSNHLSCIDWEKLAKKVRKNQYIIEPIIDTFRIKEEFKKQQALKNKEKIIKKISVVKHITANPKTIENASLYLAEGLSAISNFLVCRNPKTQGAYPLKGKFISCQNNDKSKLLKNQEVKDLLAILGLKFTSQSINNMTYKNIVIFCDEDEDGGAIKCSLINFFYTFWPDIIKSKRLLIARSPLIKAKHLETGDKKDFYSIDEFSTEADNYKILSFNKGLGSLSKDDYKKSLTDVIAVTEDDFSRQNLNMILGDSSEEKKSWIIS